MRLLLHERTASERNKLVEREELIASQTFVEKLLHDSLLKLEKEEIEKDIFIRWELGACWIQHLQDQKNNAEKEKEKEKKSANKTERAKNEMKVEGLGSGTLLKSLKNNKKRSDGNNLKLQSETSKPQEATVVGQSQNAKLPSEEPQPEINSNENELAMKKMLSDAAFARLKESETGLHCKVITLLIYSAAVLVLHLVVKENSRERLEEKRDVTGKWFSVHTMMGKLNGKF